MVDVVCFYPTWGFNWHIIASSLTGTVYNQLRHRYAPLSGPTVCMYTHLVFPDCYGNLPVGLHVSIRMYVLARYSFSFSFSLKK